MNNIILTEELKIDIKNHLIKNNVSLMNIYSIQLINDDEIFITMKDDISLENRFLFVNKNDLKKKYIFYPILEWLNQKNILNENKV